MSKQQEERELVNLLITNLIRNENGRVYVYVDRDSGAMRHTKSGWDFIAAKDSRIVFCEAKIKNSKLTDWQNFARAEISLAGNTYTVLRFFDNDVLNEETGEILRIEYVDFNFLLGVSHVESKATKVSKRSRK